MDIKEIMIHNLLLTFEGEEDAEDEYLVVEGPLQNSAGKQSRFTLSCHPSLVSTILHLATLTIPVHSTHTVVQRFAQTLAAL